jgi:hypothetical protein
LYHIVLEPLNENNPDDEGVILSLSKIFNVKGKPCLVEKVLVLALAVTKSTVSIDDVDEPVKLIVIAKGAINVNAVAASKFRNVSKLVSTTSAVTLLAMISPLALMLPDAVTSPIKSIPVCVELVVLPILREAPIPDILGLSPKDNKVNPEFAPPMALYSSPKYEELVPLPLTLPVNTMLPSESPKVAPIISPLALMLADDVIFPVTENEELLFIPFASAVKN